MATQVSDKAILGFLKGAREVTPLHSVYYKQENDGPHGCAVGALAYGVGQVNGEGEVNKAQLRRRYPILRTRLTECPSKLCSGGFTRYALHDGVRPDILSTMEHLFETHYWTFEQIGTWLAKFSPTAAKIIVLQGEIDALVAGRPIRRRKAVVRR